MQLRVHAIEQHYLVAWIDGDCRAADIIAVQAVAGIAVELRLVPRAKHDAALRARYRCLRSEAASYRDSVRTDSDGPNRRSEDAGEDVEEVPAARP